MPKNYLSLLLLILLVLLSFSYWLLHKNYVNEKGFVVCFLNNKMHKRRCLLRSFHHALGLDSKYHGPDVLGLDLVYI